LIGERICIRLPIQRMKRATRGAGTGWLRTFRPLFDIRELEMEWATGLEPATNSLKGCLLDRFAFVP